MSQGLLGEIIAWQTRFNDSIFPYTMNSNLVYEAYDNLSDTETRMVLMSGSLVYMETIQEEHNNLDFPFYRPYAGVVTYYVIPPNIFKSLNEYSNREIEGAFSNHIDTLFNNSLLDKLILISFHSEDLTYLDYFKNRNIRFDNNDKIRTSLLNGISYILAQSDVNYLNKDYFFLIRYLVEYRISVSCTEILFIYVSNIHYRMMNIGDGIFTDFTVSYKDPVHLKNIKYLIDKGVDLDFQNEMDFYSYYSIKELLTEIEYIKDIYWSIRKDYIMFVIGTRINVHTDNDEKEYICKYIGNDLLMKEILSYI
jgi:hypothetical protein